MTSTDLLATGVITALFALAARLYVINAAFGVVIDCVAFATTMEVMMTTTVAISMTPGRENFWMRVLIAFICLGFVWFFYVWFSSSRFFLSCLEADFAWNHGKLLPRPLCYFVARLFR